MSLQDRIRVEVGRKAWRASRRRGRLIHAAGNDMSLAQDLLIVANDLCPTRAGRPSHAYLRRSISTSYYAVFHALTEEVARPYKGDVRPTARRMLDHGSARDVLTGLAKGGQVVWLSGRPACSPHLKQFAEDFEYLQLARHQADYDLAYTPRKADASIAMDRARRAVGDLDAVRRYCPEQLQAMCVAMIAAPNLRRRLTR